MEQSLRDGGLIWRVLGAWAGLRAAMRAELDRDPSEGRLLFYAMLSGAIWWLGEMLMLRYAPGGGVRVAEAEFLGHASASLGAALFMRTLMLYVMAMVLHAVARALGGGAPLRASRAALFWAALVAAPAMVAAALVALLLVDDPRSIGRVADTLGSLAFAWVAAASVAEAQGFASIWRGVAVVVIMAMLVLAVMAGVAIIR
jgi:hypothetical protein